MRHLEQYEVYPQVERHVTSLPRSRVGDSFSPPPSFPLSTSLPRSIFTSPTPDPNETGLVTVGNFQERNLQIFLVIKLSGNIFSTNFSAGRFIFLPATIDLYVFNSGLRHNFTACNFPLFHQTCSHLEFVQSLKQDIGAAHSPSPTPPSLPPHTPHQLHPPPSKRPHVATPTQSTNSSSSTKTKRTPKGATKSSPASRRKKDQDSSAPKKPSNAFFWFCQEQRGSLEDQFRGEGVAGQHSLTKILAQKWGETPTDDRKVCTCNTCTFDAVLCSN